MSHELTAKNVLEVFLSCLYTEEELGGLADGAAPEGTILSNGICLNVGFHPGRIDKAKPAIVSMLSDLPDDFHKAKGGGQSFLNMCVDKNGTQWGQHKDMDQLVCLALATGVGFYCMPRESWHMFPGGVPYVVFDTEAQ